MASYLGAIDQGTTSSRFIVFDRSGRIVSTAQREHEQIYPKPGWVEHEPDEIWRCTADVIQEAMEARGLRPEDLAAIGITNQRETTVVWHKKTGKQVVGSDPPNKEDETIQVIPEKYNKASELKVDLTSGSNTHDFPLKSSKKK